jgi:predicted  nucleic acid-binding Zn-ribbon protein
MHPQLEILLELQDLKAQKREMEEAAEESSREIEKKVFKLKLDDAVAHLENKIAEMEKALDDEVENHYQQVSGRRARAVAPVLDGICYGCFMAVPTATAKTNEQIHWCEYCGSFIYFVD